MRSIKEIKEAVINSELSMAELVELNNDARVGVKKIVNSELKRQNKIKKQKEIFTQKRLNEKKYAKGATVVAGVDEVGRGPLAGPVIACAIILSDDYNIYQTNDSKTLSKKVIKELYAKILNKSEAVGIGIIDNNVIDEINIYEATKLAMKQAVENLQQDTHLLVDAMDIPVDLPQTNLIHGDQLSPSIGAASIVAKYVRDSMMTTYDKFYPGYNFKKNAGYGTSEHLKAIDNFGITPIHRQSFAPIKNS